MWDHEDGKEGFKYKNKVSHFRIKSILLWIIDMLP